MQRSIVMEQTANWNEKVRKREQLQAQSKKLLSNKNGTYRFVKIFLTSVDDNIYVLIVLFTNISMKLSRFLVNLLSIAFS